MSTLCSRWWRRPRPRSPPRFPPHSLIHAHHRLIRVVVVLSIVCCHCFILLFSSSAATTTTSSFCRCLWSARISARRLRTGRIVNNRILLLFLLVSRYKLTAATQQHRNGNNKHLFFILFPLESAGNFLWKRLLSKFQFQLQLQLQLHLQLQFQFQRLFISFHVTSVLPLEIFSFQPFIN